MPSVTSPSRIGNRLPSLWKIHGFLISFATIIWLGFMNSSYISMFTHGALLSAWSSLAQMKSKSILLRCCTTRADHSEKRRWISFTRSGSSYIISENTSRPMLSKVLALPRRMRANTA